MGTYRLHIRLFGTLELAPGDKTPQPNSGRDRTQARDTRLASAPASCRAQSLLAYLILHQDRAAPRDRLVGILWPERGTPRARRALSHALWQIRRALGPAADRLVTSRDAIAFAMQDDDWLDVKVFEESVERYTRTPGDPALPYHLPDTFSTSLFDLTEAVALYRGDLLENIYDDWALVERERLRELYLRAMERLTTLHKQRSDYGRALTYAQRLAASDPLRESAHRELMRLYHLLDRPRAALEQFEALRELLDEELGVEPSAATTALLQEIGAAMEEAEPAYLPVPSSPPPLLRDLAHLPFVGRTDERAILVDALQAALRGYGRIALVEGDAGVGKTRLVEEVAAGARWRGFQVAMSKADSLAIPAPYQQVREALSPLLTPLRCAQLAELVDPLSLAAAAPVLTPIAEHLPQLPPPAPLRPNEEQERLCQGLTRCLTGLASVAPLLFVMEDVHWADESTLQALPILVTGIPAGRVLVILTYRTAEARARRVVWKALGAIDRVLTILRMQVAPFDRAEAVSLIRRALASDEKDAAADRFGQRLQEKTGGNALFLVESLESLLEQGVLRPAQGGWRFPAEDLPLQPPASVRELISRRLTRLSAAPQAVLEHVAVLGEDADFHVLSDSTGVEPSGLTRQLHELSERGFLEETDTGYRFQHDVIRDVVYQAIPPDRLQVLHRDAGAALEELCPHRAESLALHFRLGEDWGKAVHWCRQAGERARSVYAGAQAITYYDQALDAWRRLREPDEGLGLQLHRERGRISQDTGRFDEAEADFRAAQSLARRVGDEASQARLFNHLSYLQFQRGGFEEAAETAWKALRLGTHAGHEPEVAAALFNQANALRNLGDYHGAIDLYEQAAGSFEHLDDQRRLADCLNRMGAAFNHLGGFVRAQSLMERSLAIRRRLDDKLGVSYSLINLATSHAYLGQFDLAREVAQEALEIATDIGDPYGQDAALHTLGVADLEQGRAAEAISFFQRALALARDIGDKAIEPEILGEMGRAYQHVGELDRARETLEQSLQMVSISVEKNYIAPLHAHLAGLYLEIGDDARALCHARAGLQEAEEGGDPWAAGVAHRVMGQVIGEAGGATIGSEPALHFEESIRILREIGAEAELARSLTSYGVHLRGSTDLDDARRSKALLSAARTLLRELGMLGDLTRLDSESTRRLQPEQIQVRLATTSAPTGRPLRDDEYVGVTWTVAAPQDDEVPGRIARRHQRILRLLREAAAQSAAPTLDDLARALDVSVSTIKRDLAALRKAGHDIRTRGSRKR